MITIYLVDKPKNHKEAWTTELNVYSFLQLKCDLFERYILSLTVP